MTVHQLRERAERMLCDGVEGRAIIDVLEELVKTAPGDSEPALFAHRQLAELRLEVDPWQAALHLRRVLRGGAGDDSTHALMGLCQALLGNFAAAVASYRRALSLCPDNPWYRHNLGHLLDVGVGDSEAALRHLRVAQRIEGEEDEITASLAHCLARLGELDEAASFARRAVDLAPDKSEHRRLRRWVDEGAPDATSMRATNRVARPAGRAQHDLSSDDADAVATLLAEHMARAGFSRARIARAQALWGDFQSEYEPRVNKPEVLAAAVEYALAKLEPTSGVTQAVVARRYGVAAGSVSQRYGEIRTALSLVPSDPRYS